MDDVKDQDHPQKIIIIGMENAGKTTIVNLLSQKDNISPSNPPNMIPTKGVKKVFFFRILLWYGILEDRRLIERKF